ncbi:hypothetical protein F5880DRAFT_1561576 [Lentinula raphanica]|nr:hypothetical protein F5880DRAFT_1561576 [Lentinula raphanica]
MSTASTSYTLDDAISKLKFGLSTRLEEKSERILNDDEILGLEKILYKLDRELATTKSKERQMASRYIAFNKQLTGFREMFTRYRHAREAYSMAKTYESNIRREAADAQMRAMREKYSQKQQRKQEQLREDRTRTRSTEATLTISTSDRISPELIQLMVSENLSTFPVQLMTLIMCRALSRNPPFSAQYVSLRICVCLPGSNGNLYQIGKTPRIPKGFKPAYLIYYVSPATFGTVPNAHKYFFEFRRETLPSLPVVV